MTGKKQLKLIHDARGVCDDDTMQPMCLQALPLFQSFVLPLLHNAETCLLVIRVHPIRDTDTTIDTTHNFIQRDDGDGVR